MVGGKWAVSLRTKFCGTCLFWDNAVLCACLCCSLPRGACRNQFSPRTASYPYVHTSTTFRRTAAPHIDHSSSCGSVHCGCWLVLQIAHAVNATDSTPWRKHAVSAYNCQCYDDTHRPKPSPLAAESLRVFIDAPAHFHRVGTRPFSLEPLRTRRRNGYRQSLCGLHSRRKAKRL